MTATYPVQGPGPDRHPLAPGASPEAIAGALLPGDREEFLAEYADQLAAARTSLDLSGLFEMLEGWRGIAALHADPERFRHIVRRAAELITGEPSPEDEPLEVTRAKAGA